MIAIFYSTFSSNAKGKIFLLSAINIREKLKYLHFWINSLGALQGENWNCSTSFLVHSSLWVSGILVMVTQQLKLKTSLSAVVGFVAIFAAGA